MLMLLLLSVLLFVFSGVGHDLHVPPVVECWIRIVEALLLQILMVIAAPTTSHVDNAITAIVYIGAIGLGFDL
jgi:hypothetical protein